LTASSIIPLSAYDPKTYLSFGGDFRERFETNNAANFGIGLNHSQQYVISRSEAHADLRIADQLQVFVQLQSDFAPGRRC
jgi:Alginate export